MASVLSIDRKNMYFLENESAFIPKDNSERPDPNNLFTSKNIQILNNALINANNSNDGENRYEINLDPD